MSPPPLQKYENGIYPRRDGERVNALIFLPAWAAPADIVGLRLHSALVVENVRDAVGWIAAVMLLAVVAGRTEDCESGTRNTFASEASTGESGRIVVCDCDWD